MNFYEVVFIVKQDASSSHVESIASDALGTIKDVEGDVTKTEFCGLRVLAYPIKKNKRGHFVLMNVVCPPECIKELERKFRINEDVIRFLIVRVEKLDNNPSALMKRNFRDGHAPSEQE
ncbi:MAG: 30S ribosomal protein S6 [Holosporales bacterium]|jgi:small subunit ribosomal protein S6|nr:30S ribosomal protein S6 [Holosporales bacterium]